jgi:hypothetical protein
VLTEAMVMLVHNNIRKTLQELTTYSPSQKLGP